MFSAFRRSKIVAAVILVVSLVLIVLIWRRDQGMPVAVPIIASVITLGLGIIAGRLFGGASCQHGEYALSRLSPYGTGPREIHFRL